MILQLELDSPFNCLLHSIPIITTEAFWQLWDGCGCQSPRLEATVTFPEHFPFPGSSFLWLSFLPFIDIFSLSQHFQSATYFTRSRLPIHEVGRSLYEKGQGYWRLSLPAYGLGGIRKKSVKIILLHAIPQWHGSMWNAPLYMYCFYWTPFCKGRLRLFPLVALT